VATSRLEIKFRVQQALDLNRMTLEADSIAFESGNELRSS
jgi:hypothetical protein